MDRIKEKLSAVGDAIRGKTGKSELLNLDEMPAEIAAIETGIKTEDATAVAGDILSGKTAYVKDVKVTGTIPTKTSSDLSASEATVTVPSGYYASQATKSVATATQATPSISVDSAGKITASATQTAGYVAAGTKSATKQLTVQGAQTITPGTSNKTIAAGTYLSGAQTIAGDADLKAANIKKGVNIFGVAGSYDAVELNFQVVGGTTQPSSASENTIWVNTSTTITSWVFSATQPSNPIEGMVWLKIGTSSNIEFNALKENGLQVYPLSAQQYVSGAWVDKNVKSYQSGAWVDWILWLYYNGNQFENITGGWKVVNAAGGTGSILDDGLYINYSGSADLHVQHYTKNKIDLSKIKTLYAEFEITSSHSSSGVLTFGISNNNTNTMLPYQGGVVASKGAAIGQTGKFTLKLDVSSQTSSQYVFIYACIVKGYCRKVWYE